MNEPLATSEAAALQVYLHERDVTCPRCQYNLRNLTGDRCPECGDGLILRVNLAEPKMAAYFTGLVGLAAGFGFNGLFFMLIFVLGDIEPGLASILLGGALATSIAMAVYLNGRIYLRRQPMSRQWLSAFAAWALTAATVIIFVKHVR